MKLFHLAVDVLLGISSGVSIYYAFRYHRQLQAIHRERAERVAQALQGSVLVDGVTLPLPEDERWCEKNSVFTVNGKDQPREITLTIGRVTVDRLNRVFSGHGPALVSTVATQNYAKRVWIEYRSRIARKSIAGE